jgi:hypothetical protein
VIILRYDLNENGSLDVVVLLSSLLSLVSWVLACFAFYFLKIKASRAYRTF